MSGHLIDIQPCELNFIVEVKKQSSCVVHLTNVTDQNVAFKVKTTSPKKYCVRPNVGIIKPKSTCDFTVTMQAQKYAASDLQCKDKFLIQSTTVPVGLTEDDITTGTFTKTGEHYVEETKLRVVLSSPPHSPVLLPVNGIFKQEPYYETSIPKEKLRSGDENYPIPHKLVKNIEDVKTTSIIELPISPKVVENVKSVPAKTEKIKPDKDEGSTPERDELSREVKDLGETNWKLSKEIEELRSKISSLDSKLIEAQNSIENLKDEKNSIIVEKESLNQQLAILKKRGDSRNLHLSNDARKVQVGFPPLFVCMVALVALALGFLLRA